LYDGFVVSAIPNMTGLVTAWLQTIKADALRDGPTNPDFDLEKWQQEWDAAEAELKRINLEDDIAEGRI